MRRGEWDITVTWVPTRDAYHWNAWREVTATELHGWAPSEPEGWFQAGAAMQEAGALKGAPTIRLVG
jgi:hypothetical protein